MQESRIARIYDAHMCDFRDFDKLCCQVAILSHILSSVEQLSLLLTGVSTRYCIFFILVILVDLK